MSTTTIKTNKIQKLNLDLIRLSSFNAFDGPIVVESLLAHRDLWEGVVMDRAGYYAVHAARELGKNCDPLDLIKLRDIGSGYWNVDTLYILPAKGREKHLELLAHTWAADEIDWNDDPNAGRCLRVWWD